MEILVWLLPGALIGWTASVLLRRESATGALANLLGGILGAAGGVWLLGPALGVPMSTAVVGSANLQMAVLGAILLLAAVNLALPGRRARVARPAPRPAAATTSGEQPARG